MFLGMLTMETLERDVRLSPSPLPPPSFSTLEYLRMDFGQLLGRNAGPISTESVKSGSRQRQQGRAYS